MPTLTPEEEVVIRKELAYTMREIARELDGPRPTEEIVPSLAELRTGLGMLLAAAAQPDPLDHARKLRDRELAATGYDDADV